MKISEYVKQYRLEHGLSMQAFGERCGLSRAYISILERGINPTTGKPFVPAIETLNKIAKATNSNLDTLLTLLDNSQSVIINKPPIPNAPNVHDVKPVRIPILGRIACGKPIFEQEDFQGYASFISEIHVDFCLIAQGDSMMGARIKDGDVVFIRQQPDIENGEIAAVSINDEVTLKRVYISDTQIILMAENPKYAPMVYSKDEIECFRVLGKAVAFQSRVV